MSNGTAILEREIRDDISKLESIEEPKGPPGEIFRVMKAAVIRALRVGEINNKMLRRLMVITIIILLTSVLGIKVQGRGVLELIATLLGASV